MAERVADIDRARDALARESWAQAYEELERLDPSSLTPEDLDDYADAAWWLAKVDQSISLRQKAYAGYAESGQELRACWCAGRLCIEHFLRGEASVGSGWLMRARRHAADRPNGVEHGYLAMLEATIARFSGDLEAALQQSQRAVEIGRRFRDPDLNAMAIHTEGLVLIARGSVAEGMALLDEAMTSVVAGELSSYFTGVVYCDVIAACLELADIRRASEWNEAARSWCEALAPGSPYPGLCRVNRAALANLRGAWPEAEAEAARASEELMVLSPVAAAEALYEVGEARRRIGDLAGAEEAFGRANELGFEPQPGLALLRLAQGDAEAAHHALSLAVGSGPRTRPRQARILGAQVEVALAVNDLETARSATEELEAIAHELGTPMLDAMAAAARGAIRLAEGDPPGALDRLRHARVTWQELRTPYEAARARVLYGLATREAGDEEDAKLELRAALAAFERLGAATDAASVAELLGERLGLPRGVTAREAEVLRLVATGKTNRDIAVELVISEHTVARHLQNIYAKLGVPSRAAATAFAFEHGLV
ncbi:MAG: LuxR C-terminal-related transcriptional regulator [Actinobacteria bacterium]|nr:LuxR C-terminal-related transcriptional regulator [Actinomycetota bacterium]